MPVPVVLAAATAASSIANSIANIADANKRRVYEQNLNALNAEQKVKLDKLILQANSEQARQQILAQTLGTANAARIDALAKVQVEREKTKKTIIIASVIGLAAIVLLLVAKRN